MRLLPEDLGTKWHVALVRQRALGPAVAWSKPVEPKLGRLGRLWTRGLDIPDEVAAATLPMAASETQGYAVGIGAGLGWLPFAGVIAAYFAAGHNPAALAGAEAVALSAAGGFYYWAGVHLPRRTVRRLHKTPVRAEEITLLRNADVPGLPPVVGQLAQKFFRLWNRGVQTEAEDPLERAFLGLVLDVLKSDDIPEAMHADLRATLRDLGDAVAQMPPAEDDELPVGSVEAADLRGDAQMLLARAEREHDPVVEASLRRQADALLERARAAENAGVVARRTRYLRQELRAQIDALRAALPSFGRATSTAASSRVEVGAFARLAESVRGVAAEAASVAAAHDELNESSYAAREAALGRDTGEETRHYGAVEEEEPQHVRLGR